MAESEIQSALAKTCRNCQVANLIEDVKINRCSKCESIYCTHFASAIDPQYCIECLADVTLHKEIVTKTYTHETYDEETDTTITTQYSRRAKQLKLEGSDWLFVQRKIVNMSDDALELAIEYHREILQAMMHEREDRRTKYLHRFAGVKLGTETVSSNTSADGLTVKKTKTISSTKAAATATGMMESMLASGKMDAATLLKMLQDMTSKAVK